MVRRMTGGEKMTIGKGDEVDDKQFTTCTQNMKVPVSGLSDRVRGRSWSLQVLHWGSLCDWTGVSVSLTTQKALDECTIHHPMCKTMR